MTAVPKADAELMRFAATVCRRAGHLSAQRFHTGERPRLKADGSEVTDTGVAVEELLHAELSRRTPQDSVMGEETPGSSGRSGRRWIIDPIDGTEMFTRGVPLFSNLLAYEDEYGPALGVINLPMAGETIFAGRGLGCWWWVGDRTEARSASRVRLARHDQLDGVTVHALNLWAWSEELLVTLHRRVLLQAGRGDAIAALVTGRADAVVSAGHRRHVEDLAPLPVIVGEAEGRITTVGGEPAVPGDGSILAAHPSLHGMLQSAIAGVDGGRDWRALGG